MQKAKVQALTAEDVRWALDCLIATHTAKQIRQDPALQVEMERLQIVLDCLRLHPPLPRGR